MLRRPPPSAAAPTCASTTIGSRRAGKSGAACGSCCCPSYKSKVIRMLLSRHRRQIIDAGSFAADAPYAEQAGRKEGRLDGALLSAWGRVSPYLLSALARDRLKRFAGRAEDLEPQLVDLPDRRLRELADELRARLLSASLYSHERALSFALAREAARRHLGM